MPLYRYQSGSMIDDVTILTNESGGVRAYLHASPQATAAQLQLLRGTMTGLGWHSVATMHDGQAVLEVRGFKKPDRILDFLRHEGAAQGNPTVQSRPGDQRSSKQKMANATLRFAGITYIVGDLSYMVYTWKKYRAEHLQKNKATNFFNRMDIIGGIGYGLGSLALAFYGSRDQSQNTIQAASQKIESYMRKEGYAQIDNSGVNQASAEPKHGFFGSIDHLVAKYPSETLNSIYVGVGGALSSAAIFRAFKEHHAGNFRDRNTELIDIGLGTITAASAIAGLTIKEKRREEGEKKPEGFFAGIWEWIQEKPLRATGIGYMVATFFHAGATYKKWTQGDQLVRETAGWRGAFVVANIVSEVFMALSSKGHGTGVKPDESVDQTVIAGVADTILRQDPTQRGNLIHQVAGYMASRDVLGGKAEEIAADIRKQIAALEQNPWVLRHAGSSMPQLPVPAIAHTATQQQPGTRIAEATHLAPLTEQQMAITTG